VFLLQPGDQVRFQPIEGALFRDLDRAAGAGAIIAEPSE
jgi:allophanate hydrolase subunit 1